MIRRRDNMNGMTTDIYFDIKDKDNDAHTNEITNRDVSLQNPF